MMHSFLNSKIHNSIKILLLSCLFIVAYSASAKTVPVATLTILNWSEYMDPKLLRKFEKMHNIKIQEIYFETDDTRDEMMLDSDGKGYDIIVVNGAMVDRYIKHNWLEPITIKQVTNLKHIDPKWLAAFPGANGYAVPYLWGTLGIAYRTDLVPVPVISWRQLLEPEEYLKGKILMIKSSRDLVGAALKALGYSMNSSNPDELAKAYAMLIKQKPYVGEYSTLALTEESALVKGTIAMSMSYNGDALTIQQHHDKIAFVVPEEGTNIWIDYFTVSRHSNNKLWAFKFINFLSAPENAATLAQQLYFATPNSAAEKKLPKDFLEDKTIYPGKTVLEKSEFYKPLPPATVRKYNSIFSQIVTQP